MIRKIFPVVLTLGNLLTAACVADAGDAIPPIREIKNVKPKPAVFKGSRWKKPIKIESEKAAGKYFGKKAVATIKKQVNFKQQFVLLFAWQGSGQDRLSFVVAESFPEQVFFSRKPGRTRDLRRHARVFALRANVKWRVRGK